MKSLLLFKKIRSIFIVKKIDFSLLKYRSVLWDVQKKKRKKILITKYITELHPFINWIKKYIFENFENYIALGPSYNLPKIHGFVVLVTFYPK